MLSHHAHSDFVAASPLLPPASQMRGCRMERQIKERINTNFPESLSGELYKRRLQEVRSDEERGHLKEDHKLEIPAF